MALPGMMLATVRVNQRKPEGVRREEGRREEGGEEGGGEEGGRDGGGRRERQPIVDRE
jgi:hypothetical protein